MTRLYRTLFTGTLVQESGLSVGGSDATLSSTDAPLSRDGENTYILRGQSLAGALTATARKLVKELPVGISAGLGAGSRPVPSLWQMFASHPDESPVPEIRQHVGIRQDTGAATDGVLYDVEVLPRGTCWKLLLEVDTFSAGGDEAERIAAAALLEWRRGRCWLGRDVARGLGWLRLENLRALRLDLDWRDIWPDSREKPIDLLDKIISEHGCEQIPADRFDAVFEPVTAGQTRWRYLDIEGTIRVGSSANGYGLDAVAVGGHATATAVDFEDAHWLAPRGQRRTAYASAFEPDHCFVLTRGPSGALEPFLPGSSLRGPLRHALSRTLRRNGTSVRDPNVDRGNDAPGRDLVGWLFGTVGKSAALLLRDAHLEGSEWTAAWLQHHAEDEFSAGVYGSGKFDRAVIVNGTFRWRMVVEYRHHARIAALLEDLEEGFRGLATAGHLPLGGGQWRAIGWPAWTVARIRDGRAGEDAAEVAR